MKLAVVDREIERVAVAGETRFSIKGTAKAFRVLSSGLYRDKIQAIIREVCSNAYDGHVAAGRPEVPFEVHLPNALEPVFSVRDYGTGLSETEMNSVYTTYFESTKAGSNKFIGAFGLGSKSPFSYVDSFTITTWLDGTQSTYVAFINEDGMFSLTRMASISTNQQNGIEVTIPVRHVSDYGEFRSKAQLVLSRFAVRPSVVGAAEFVFDNPMTLLAGDGWRLTTRADTEKPALAFMGNVAYPIVTSAIETLSPVAQRLLSTAIDLDFPIGALDVTAGREDLSYDRPTLEALEQKALAVNHDAPIRVVAAIQACRTEYVARLLYGTLFGRVGVFHRLMGNLGVPYASRMISSNVLTVDLEEFPGCRIIAVIKTPQRRVRFQPVIGLAPVEIVATAGTRLVVDDLSRGGKQRIEAAFRSPAWAGASFVYLLQGDSPASLEPLRARLDGMPETMTSSLPAVVSQRYDKRPRAVLNPALFRKNIPIDDFHWTVRPVDLAAGGLYVRRSHHYVVNETGKMEREFTLFLCRASQLGLLDTSSVIVGLDKKAVGQVAANGKWTRLDIHIRKLLLADPETSDRLRGMANLYDYNTAMKSNWRLSAVAVELRRLSRLLDPHHTVSILIRDWFAASRVEAGPDANAYLDLFRLLNLSASVAAGSEPFTARFDAVFKRYPFLRALEENKVGDVSQQHFSGYITWVDSLGV